MKYIGGWLENWPILFQKNMKIKSLQDFELRNGMDDISDMIAEEIPIGMEERVHGLCYYSSCSLPLLSFFLSFFRLLIYSFNRFRCVVALLLFFLSPPSSTSSLSLLLLPVL
jgi:hypothetical protein